MSGFQNTTGAVSGIVGKTEGTPGAYFLAETDDFLYTTQTASTTKSQDAINISDDDFVTVTPASDGDLIDLKFYVSMRLTGGKQEYIGVAIQRSTASDFSASPTILWASGRHAFGAEMDSGHTDFYTTMAAPVCRTSTQWGLTAGTTYYLRMTGQTHSVGLTAACQWGHNQTSKTRSGVSLNMQRWVAI